MGPKKLLLMALAVGAMAAFIWFYERDLPDTEERLAKEKKVLGLEADDVAGVQIEWADGTVRLERDPIPEEAREDSIAPTREWRLLEPMVAVAERAATDALVRALVDLEKKRTIEDADPAVYGLEPPRVTVTLEAESDVTVFELGDEIPGTSDRMARHGGDPALYLVAGSLFDQLTREPGEWRSKRLFTGNRAAIQRVRLRGAAGEILLAKRGRDYWLEAPVTDAAAKSLVDDLVTALVGLEVSSFVDDPSAAPQELGLEPAAASLEVVLEGDAEPFSLRWGSPVEIAADEGPAAADLAAPSEHYAQVGEQIFISAVDLGAAFDRSIDEWRSPRLTELSAWEIDQLAVSGPGVAFALLRDTADWRRDGDKIDYGAPNALVNAIADTEASEVVMGTVPPVGAAFTLTLTSETGDQAISVSPPIEGFVAATVEGREVVLRLDESTWAELVEKIEDVATVEPIPDEPRTEETEGVEDE